MQNPPLYSTIFSLLLYLATPLSASAPSREIKTPQRDQNYTSTREISRLIVLPDATLWALTSGGALRLQKGTWKKFETPPPAVAALKPTTLKWRGQPVTASLDALTIGDGKSARRVPMPPSTGTHISALLPRGDTLWAALFGDGLWQWNGSKWSSPALKLPPQAREITALSQSPNGRTLYLGTRREGIWQFANAKWQQHLQPNEPFAHNIQFLQSYRGAIWASTLEDGLVVRDGALWRHISKSPTTLSSNAPRQMAVFKGKLYVRHSNEVVDQFDGTTWKRNIFPILPRKQVIALAADQSRLYLGQWGGWSDWAGNLLSYHLRIPELQIVPLQHILPDGDRVWLGTENRGLFCWNRTKRKLDHFDERSGLPSDWITALHRTGPTLYAGTFGSGLAYRTDGSKAWQTAPALKNIGITSIVSDTTGQTYIATRSGLFARKVGEEVRPLSANLSPTQREIQSLLATQGGLWIGTRNSLLFRPWSTLATPK